MQREGERQLRLEEIKAKKEVEFRRIECGLPSLLARRDDLKVMERDLPTFEPQEAEAFFKHFERIATLKEWPEDDWAALVQGRNPYYSDSIFSKDEDVQAHVGTIQSLKTKVLYGGRWEEGSGMTLGEEAEQVFAYLSRYNSTTKNMLKAERTEELTEGAVFWNHRKIDGLARALVTRLRKARETEITVSNEIDKLDVQKSLIQEWRSLKL
ncbi:uncharacterized protein [Procambarus clarkii]|uniref:uncharacterized protein n=1 Tax=Procambarus clarkii TaxID=6728 RepID=UPI003742DE20